VFAGELSFQFDLAYVCGGSELPFYLLENRILNLKCLEISFLGFSLHLQFFSLPLLPSWLAPFAILTYVASSVFIGILL